MRLKGIVAFTLTVFYMANSFAWIENSNVTADQVWAYEDKYGGDSFVRFSNGTICYIPPGEKQDRLYSIAISALHSRAKVIVHCYDLSNTENPVRKASGRDATKIHRFILQQS